MGIESPGDPVRLGNGDRPIQITEITDGPRRDPLTDRVRLQESADSVKRLVGDVRFLAVNAPETTYHKEGEYPLNGEYPVTFYFQSTNEPGQINDVLPAPAGAYQPHITHQLEARSANNGRPLYTVSIYSDDTASVYEHINQRWVVPGQGETLDNKLDASLVDMRYDDETLEENYRRSATEAQVEDNRFDADKAWGIVSDTVEEIRKEGSGTMLPRVQEQLESLDTLFGDDTPIDKVKSHIDAFASHTETHRFAVSISNKKTVRGVITNVGKHVDYMKIGMVGTDEEHEFDLFGGSIPKESEIAQASRALSLAVNKVRAMGKNLP